VNAEDCTLLLDNHPAEALSVAMDGSVLYANRRARALLGSADVFEIQLDDINFYTLWAEPSEKVRDMLARCAGSSAWQPFSLEVEDGAHAGLRVALRARGVRKYADASVRALIVSDDGRIEPFREHRRLIRRLNGELADLRRMEDRLKRTLANEEKLHAELVHRVKNNLSVLSALVRTRAAATDDPAVKEALNEIGTRIGAVAIVHDILDRKKQIDIVDAEELVDTLCGQLEASICPPGVTIGRELVSYPLHIEDATPLCLLINELITNSLKHAFKGNNRGRVDVALRRNGVDKIEIHVADDGDGFDEQGVNGGSGSRIVRALAMQLRGELTIRSDHGTSWQLIFPPLSHEQDTSEGHPDS
jgi:two-component sensor histidine kinase